MHFGWKRLIPIALLWIVAVATIRAISLDGGIDRQYLLIGIGIAAALLLVLFFIGEQEEEPPSTTSAPEDLGARPFPVPPMPAGGAVRGPAATLTFETSRPVTAEAQGGEA